MISKMAILAIALGCLALATADPIFRNQGGNVARKPVGQCPSRDGELPTYLPDADNCEVFYECSGGEAFPKDCLPGLCFDTTLNVCAFPPSKRKAIDIREPLGECPREDNGIHPTYLPDAVTCRFFYECQDGETIPKECPRGLCFDPKLHACSTTRAISDRTQDKSITINRNNDYNSKDIDNKDVARNDKQSGDGKNNINSDTDTQLGDKLNHDNHHPNKCNNHHNDDHHDHGDDHHHNDDDDHHHNDDHHHHNDHDHDHNHHHNDEDHHHNDHDDGNDDHHHHNDDHDVDEVVPFDAVGSCPPRDTNETIFLPDSKNCSLYYICSNGKPIQSVCPPDMAWNSEAHICDWDLDANCNIEETIIPFTAVGECPPRDTNATVYLPDSDDCSVYYICSNGRPIQSECPPDMAWNDEKHICDWDLDANCNHDNTSSYVVVEVVVEVVPLSAVGACPPRDTNVTVFLPDSSNCTVYYICSNGRPIQAVCAPGMAWNSKLNICDWAIDVDCSNSRKSARKVVGECPAKDPPMPVYLPDSDDCKIYYECSGGIPFVNDCPPDLEFNPILRVCDFPLDAGCSIPNNSTAPPEPTNAPNSTTTVSFA